MPVLDGFEATKEIRKIENLNKYPRTIVCGFSAECDPSMNRS